jgi:RHS repeat-associated protein
LYAVQDANWNVVALVDTAGAVVERYVYDPYGVRTVLTPAYGARASSSYVWTVGFQGMSFDSVAGLSHQRARWYSPTLGRWVTMDPMGYGAGDVNLYRAMENKLTTRLDPSGLAPFAAEISVSNIEEAPIQVLDYGKHMWPVRFRLKKPSDKDKGGWVIQHVVREVKIDYPAVEKKLSGKVDYWEAWRVEPNKTGPEPRELVPEALEYLSRLKLDFDGVAANDWYGLTRQVTAPYGQSRGSYTIIGKLYYIDCMGAGDLPSSWKVFNGDPKAGGVKSAGTLRSIHDQEVKSDPASKELMSIIDKAKPVDHILMVSWKMNGKTTIDKKVP